MAFSRHLRLWLRRPRRYLLYSTLPSVILVQQVEYHRQGSEAHFRGILNDIVESLTPETERLYADDRRAFDVGRIRILNALAADSVKQATKCTDRSARDRQYAAALSHLTSADRVDNMSELTWVGKGVFYLCQGELDRAKYFFENARKQRPNFPATLGEAAVNFHNGNYKQALELYRCGVYIEVSSEKTQASATLTCVIDSVTCSTKVGLRHCNCQICSINRCNNKLLDARLLIILLIPVLLFNSMFRKAAPPVINLLIFIVSDED